MAAAPAAAETVTLGHFQITRISAGTYWWDGGAIFGVVPKTLWSRKSPVDSLNRVPLAFNCYLIRTPAGTILVETGGGDKLDARGRERAALPPESEPLPAVIARHGFDPDSIDIVVNSHLHWDHCGGNTILRDGVASPAFPRARYFAPRGEWEHAHQRLLRDKVSYIDANYDPLVESGQMTLVDTDCEIAPGIRMCRAPGHTRNMMVVTAASEGETFCFLSDLVPGVAHLHPTWITGFDLYPLETIENKFHWLNAAVQGNWLCGFGHDLDTPFARILTDLKTHFRV